MRTTKNEIRNWLEGAWLENDIKEYSHMIVVCDTFNYDDYPVYVKRGDSVKETIESHHNKEMQMVMEVYDLYQDIEEQLTKVRTWNVPKEE